VVGLLSRSIAVVSVAGTVISWLQIVATIRLFVTAREIPHRIVSDRKSTRLNSSHIQKSRMPSSA